MTLTDVMILGGNHAIVSQGSSASCVSKEGLPEQISLGLYKPPKDMSYDVENLPSFIDCTYRLLSACIVNKEWYPTEFSEEVLKESIPLLQGQSLYADHYSSVRNVVGSVAEAYWDESFMQEGIKVPAGINGVLRVDAKSNENLARGMLMTPPSVHSNSVTVTFEWKPSHGFEDIWDFYSKIVTFTNEGELIRSVDTKIISNH